MIKSLKLTNTILYIEKKGKKKLFYSDVQHVFWCRLLCGMKLYLPMNCIYFLILWRSRELLIQCFSPDNLCKQLDPDHARQNVGSDLDPNCLTL